MDLSSTTTFNSTTTITDMTTSVAIAPTTLPTSVKPGEIAGICVGAVGAVIVVIVVIYFVWRWRRNKMSDKKTSPPSPPSADDLQPHPPAQVPAVRKPKSRPSHALQPRPQVSTSSTEEESYMSVPEGSTNETYENGNTTQSIRNSCSSIDIEYENAPQRESTKRESTNRESTNRESTNRESTYRESSYGEYIVPMENVPDQQDVSSPVNRSNDNTFYFDMHTNGLQPSPSADLYQSPDPPPRPCLSQGYVNVSQENVSQDHSSTTALSSSAVTNHAFVQTKSLRSQSQEPVGSKRPDPIGATNGEVKGPQDPRGCKSQKSGEAKIQEDRPKTPKHAISSKTTVAERCVKPTVAAKPGGANVLKINPKLKNIASKFDETAKSNGAIRQKESLLTMQSWEKTPTPQIIRKDSTTLGQGDSDEDSDIDYENVNDYQNTPSKQVEPRRSPAGTPRNLKLQPGIHNREQRQKIENKQKQGPAVGR